MHRGVTDRLSGKANRPHPGERDAQLRDGVGARGCCLPLLALLLVAHCLRSCTSFLPNYHGRARYIHQSKGPTKETSLKAQGVPTTFDGKLGAHTNTKQHQRRNERYSSTKIMIDALTGQQNIHAANRATTHQTAGHRWARRTTHSEARRKANRPR